MSTIVKYDMGCTGIPGRITEYHTSANTPDYLGLTGLLINPGMTGIEGILPRYWKIDNDENEVIAMTDEEKIFLDSTMTQGDENYHVEVYDKKNRIQKETWYNTDNGNGVYSGKVREITYTYSGKDVLYRTEKQYMLDGSVVSSEVFEYYTNNRSDGKDIILKRK